MRVVGKQYLCKEFNRLNYANERAPQDQSYQGKGVLIFNLHRNQSTPPWM